MNDFAEQNPTVLVLLDVVHGLSEYPRQVIVLLPDRVAR